MAVPKNTVGRPLKFKTPEELQIAVNKYFDDCDEHTKTITRDGIVSEEPDPYPYTMSGLAYAIGIDRRNLIEYNNREPFHLTIKEARDRVEADMDRRMNAKDTFTPGLIFSAKNNFGWVDKTEVDQNIKGTMAVIEPDEELADQFATWLKEQ